jgi:hypothetical protein
VVFGTYRDLLVAVATASGALTGLLFVALSLGPGRGRVAGPPVIRQIRAAAAMLAFTNALAVSLYALVPGTRVGYPAVALGIIGIVFTAAAIRSILASRSTAYHRLGQLGLIVLLLLIFGTELVAGIAVLAAPASTTALQAIGYALVTSLIVGIARAWELVGERDTGLTASILALAGRAPAPPAGTGGPASGNPPEHEAAGHQPDEPGV